MPAPYRSSALSTVHQKRVAFGTAEHSVIRVAITPEEVLAKLSAITGPSPARRRRKPPDKAFFGAVSSTHFSLAPSSWVGAFVRVQGEIRSEGGASVVLLRVAFSPRMGLFVAIFTCAAAGVLFAAPRLSFDLVQFVVIASFLIAASVVATLRGITGTSQAILATLDPDLLSSDPTSVPDLDPDVLMNFDAWMKRLDDWEFKHLK